jgi:hypothetical protein
MTPAATTPSNSKLCPRSRPAEKLETELPSAGTAGRGSGGARVPPSCADESAARSPAASRDCAAPPPISRTAIAPVSAVGSGGTDSSATAFALDAGPLCEDNGAGPDNTVATGTRTGGGSNSTTSVTTGWSAGGNTSMTGGNACVKGVRSTGSGGSSGALMFRSSGGRGVEAGGAGGVGSCAAAASGDPASGAVLASSVCADAGDALASSQTATANRPRRRKPPITATLVLMIGIERCITPRSARPCIDVPRRPTHLRASDKQDQSPESDDGALFPPCSPFSGQ